MVIWCSLHAYVRSNNSIMISKWWKKFLTATLISLFANLFYILSGLHLEELNEDTANYKTAVRNYWSLLSPLIFSDHPKRPGDEDPSPPYNMLRNVLDMNARYGGLNAALLEAGKSVWVMNVVPTTGPNYLPLILDRGYVGVLHDWWLSSLAKLFLLFCYVVLMYSL